MTESLGKHRLRINLVPCLLLALAAVFVNESVGQFATVINAPSGHPLSPGLDGI